MSQKIIEIAALANNRVIGNNGTIPWHSKEDFKLFKNFTQDNIIVMGRKTWESLPKKPLPNRINIVLTSQDIKLEGAIVCNSIDEVLKYAQHHDKDLFICGGSKVYEEFLTKANYLYLSFMKGEFQGDTFFPQFNLEDYEIEEEQEYDEFTFRKLKKKVFLND